MLEKFRIQMLKWLKWEFWPFWFFYMPVYVKFLILSAKARSMAFFTAANPLMEQGGFTDYSKYNVLKHIHSDFLPKTILLSNPTENKTLEQMRASEIDFPIILKPDIGERGFGVEKIDSLKALTNYFETKKNIGDIILQEFISYPIELGIMYSKKNSEISGQISSIVSKQFLAVTGDGASSLGTLISGDKRSKFYLDSLLKIYAQELEVVLEKNETKELVAIGNHCRGTMFLDYNHLINNNLVRVFDAISKPIVGYHFGRFDLRVPSIEDLYKGKNIKIMELNGSASEPAHIYDPNMQLSKAYVHLFAHWQRLYEISIENHQNGVPYGSALEIWKAVRQRGKFKKIINNTK